ncbi:MAG: Flp pilus assembly complex ATPase component TadA [Actinomycetota bacterium]
MRLQRSPNAQSPAGRFPPNLPALSFSTDIPFRNSHPLASVHHLGMEIDLPEALTKLLARPGLTDLILNGHLHTYIDVGQGLIRTSNPFETQAELAQTLIELGFQTGARVDIAKPISDFVIAGLRFHVVLGHGVSNSPMVSIRKHPATQVRLEHLLEVGMFTDRQLESLKQMLLARENIVVAGATSAGKTTLLGALIAELDERIICIEQIPELVLTEPAISLHERLANQEGLGAISMQQLVIEALRMRPDRIVVGEIRGSEFGVLLQAMNNGHRGTMTTLHCKSLADLPNRLILLGMLSGFDRELTGQMVSQSFDVVLQLERVSGVRKLTQIGRFGQGLKISEVAA